MFTTAYPTKRYRSAWIGIAVHSAQSVFLAILIVTLVVRVGPLPDVLEPCEPFGLAGLGASAAVPR
jgi:hypothetical protein